ncbi:hypothetical protein UlMin_000122 [Ulmus minor]
MFQVLKEKRLIGESGSSSSPIVFEEKKGVEEEVVVKRVLRVFDGESEKVEMKRKPLRLNYENKSDPIYASFVEYAPSQRVPKQWSKKDGCEGTIDNDPDYLEFLEVLAKPVENLPSAEIKLERREAERAVLGAGKEIPIITPLMDFVRQKRVAKSGSRRSLSNGKLSQKSAGNDWLLSDKSTLSSVAGTDVLGESGKKKVMLLTGKVKKNSHQNQRREGSGRRIIKSILLNKDARHTQSSGAHSDLHSQTPNREKDRRHPRRAKNKDRLDCGVWAPRNHSDGSFANDESLSSTASQPARLLKSLKVRNSFYTRLMIKNKLKKKHQLTPHFFLLAPF